MQRFPGYICFFYLFILAFATFPQTTFAHRLNVFGWIEGERIYVESNFRKNRPARQASVSILAPENEKPLLEGKTDDLGKASFSLPVGYPELIITVNAGQGHQNSWNLKIKGAAVSAKVDLPADQTQKNNPPSLTAEDIRLIIREELEAIDQPRSKNTPALIKSEPGPIEIIGGIGWIIGIGGIYLWFKARKKA